MVDGDDDFEFSVPDELMKKDPPQSEDPVLRIFQAANNAASSPLPGSGVHSTAEGEPDLRRLSDEVQWLKEQFAKVLERQQLLIETLRTAIGPMQKIEERVAALEKQDVGH